MEENKETEEVSTNVRKVDEVKVVGKIDLSTINQKTRPSKKTKKQKEDERRERDKQRRQDQDRNPNTPAANSSNEIRTNVNRLTGPTIVGKIDLPETNRGGQNQNSDANQKKKRTILVESKSGIMRTTQHLVFY